MNTTLSTPMLVSLFLIVIRVLAVLMTAPIWSSRSIPTMVKIGFGALLAFMILPLQQEEALPAVPEHPLAFGLLIAQELLMGVSLGFVASLVFATVTMAASLMGVQIGFRASNLFDPINAAPTGVLEQFYSLLAMVLFLTINGHHWLLMALVRTFEAVPLGAFVLDGVTVGRVLAMTNATLSSAVRVALPVAGAMLLADLGLGLIARAVPQIQVFFLGMPLKMALGFVALAFTLVFTVPLIRALFGDVAGNMYLISR